MSRNIQSEPVNRGFMRVLALMRKELDWVIKDKISMVILLISPLILLYLISNASFASLVSQPTIYIIDQDNTTYSQRLINSFSNSDFGITEYNSHQNPNIATVTNAQRLIHTSALQAYIIIPKGFEASLINDRRSNLTIVINGINQIQAQQVQGIIYLATLEFQQKYQIFNGEILTIPKEEVVTKITGLGNDIPELISIVLFASLNLVVSQSIVADKPLKRVLLSPARKFEVIIAKTLAYSFLALLLSLGALLMLLYIFDVPLVSTIGTFIIIFMGALFGITLGILVSTIASSQIQAAQMFLFLFVFQMLFVLYFRIQPLVSYMPVEIIRNFIINIGYRGIPLNQSGWFIPVVGYNALILFVSFIIFSLRKSGI